MASENARDMAVGIAVNADSNPIIRINREMNNTRRNAMGVNRSVAGMGQSFRNTHREMIDESQAFVKQADRQSALIRNLAKTMGSSATQLADNWRDMSDEMKKSLIRNHNDMRKYRQQLMGVEGDMWKLSNQMGHYKGTTNDFMSEVNKLGKEHKKISEQMINSNVSLRQSYIQQAATVMNLSTTSSKITKVYDDTNNALYRVNKPLLAVTDGMERLAKQGNPVVIALKQLGPNASMKELQDRINLINTGIMRQQMLLMVMGAAWIGFTAIVARTAMGPDVEKNLQAQAQAWADYRQAVDQRTQEIANTFGLFEQVQMQATNPRQLYLNLQQQIKIMQGWQTNLSTLAQKGVDQGFIAELRKMGPSAAGEIAALTQMSDKGLNEYVAMWKEKHQLARTAATTELEKLRQETVAKVQGLKDSLKPLGVAVYEFKNVWASALAPFVEFWGQMASYVVKAGTKVGEFVQKLNDISPWITKIAGMFAFLATTMVLILTPMAIGIGYIAGMKVAFAAAWMAIKPFAIGLASVGGTAMLVAGGVIALGAALYLLWTRSETFRTAVISGWESIKQSAISVYGFLKPYILQAFEAIVSFGQQKLTQLRQFWDENGQQIFQAVKNIWTPIGAVIKTVLGAVWSVMKFVWPAVLFLIKSVWNNIKGVIDGGLKVILGVVKLFSSIFTGDFGGMWEAVKQIFSGAVQFIWNFVQLTFYGKLLGAGKTFIMAFRSGFTTMWTGIKSIFTSGVTNVRNFFVNGFNWLRNFSNNIVSSMTSGIATRFMNMVNNTRKLFTILRAYGDSIFKAMWGAIRGTVSNIVTGVRTGFTTMKNRAVEIATSLKTTVMNRFTDIVNAAKNLPKRIGDGIKAMAKGAMSGVKALANTLAAGLESVLNKITQDGINKVLSKLGVDKKYQIPKFDIPRYAQGTKGHPGGPALLGDGRGTNAGPELYRTPQGKVGLSPATNTIMNLPKGTQVLSATNTRKVLGGMPAYNQGNTTVGDFMAGAGNAIRDKVATAATKAKDFAFDVWDYASDPGMLMNKVFDTFNLKVPNVSGAFGQVASGAVSKVKDGAIEYVKSKIGSLMDFGGGFTGGMEKDPHKIGAGAGKGGMMRYVEYWYNQVKDRFGKTNFMGGFNNRNVRGGSSKSMHSYGRAFDIGGSHETMSKIAEYLRTTATNLQYVIYNHKIAGPGQGKPWRNYDGVNPHTDHVHADFKAVSTGGGAIANIKGGAAAWRSAILKAAGQMKEPVTSAQVDGIIAQIHRESKGNQTIFQDSRVNDINMRNGNPARGLLQYIPQTFKKYMMPGHTNILSGFDQLMAFFNNTNWRKDLPYGRRGWGPTGARKYYRGGRIASRNPVWVGENGPEIAQFPGGTKITSNRDSMAMAGSYDSSGTSTGSPTGGNIYINKVEVIVQGKATKEDGYAAAEGFAEKMNEYFGGLNRIMPMNREG
ncbi:hypothetical protein [Domibacillus iocasae]|uniref:ARB-07466-like C-terminal domain-containing protein n=1 Tax=Domibacillus iocasae TaxID=1714016 RepID=A0A1E7DQ57_9BACI|nr:hypothetical protein [Domibacillus iocasae]OES45227.1 hypothetical protein BA724_04255 [Domibacillus iocasae]